MKNETVLEVVRPRTDRQFTDIAATLIQSIPELTFADAQSVSGNKGAFLADINAVFVKYYVSSIIERTVAAWQLLYADMGLNVDLSGVRIPQPREGFTRLVIVAQGLGIEQVYQHCKSLFPCWKVYNQSLDIAVPTNDRDPGSGSYAIWTRDRVEADEELANKSADDLTQEKVPGNGLLERLLLERKYFKETGQHLDISNVTACTGSRDVDGDVPSVYWSDDGLRVSSRTSGYRGPRWRSREVVS